MVSLRKMVLVSVVLCLSGVAWSNELFVDQQRAQASDKNPGTEALPFKTIQPAIDAVKPGDTIYVKAGDYEEPVKITKSGNCYSPITLSAWKDDRVRLGYRPRALPVEGAWQPITGSKSFQVKLTEDVPDDLVVVQNDKPLLTRPKDTPPPDDKPLWVTYRKADRTLMFNGNGKDPASLGKIEYSRRGGINFWMDRADWWTLRHLEFNWLQGGLHFVVNCSIVEDCYFDHLFCTGILTGGRGNIIRRCNFYRCGCALCYGGPATVIEDNLIVDCGMTPEEDIRNDGTEAEPGLGPTSFKGENLGQVFANNIVADCTGTGWYADIGAKSCRIMGNAFWDDTGGGIYNEAAVDDTLVIGNYFHKSGLSSSCCVRFNVVDNFFDECGVVWHNRDWFGLRSSYMVLRGNAFFKPGYGCLSDFGIGYGKAPYPEGFTNSLVDFNRIWATPGTLLINDGGAGKKYQTLEEIRNAFHWEHHGDVIPLKDQTPRQAVEAMGGSVVTFRVPWGKRTGEARPMLSDAGVECRWPGMPESWDARSTPASFWRVADGAYNAMPLFGYNPGFPFYPCWQPQSMAGYGLGENAGCRWYIDAEAKFPASIGDMSMPKTTNDVWPNRPTWSNGNHWLVMVGLTPEKMLPQGVGYWSPHLATAPGAKITVSLKMRGKDLVSTDKGSPSVWLEFTNETGQNRRRAFLVGKDDQGNMHHEEVTKGSYDWTEVKETITAPEGAIRMALFFGLRPCKGEVDFDDINIRTASEGPGATEAEILGPRLPLARFRETLPVDLAKVANRALIDEVDNDGKGGWSDQGSMADMREFKTGERRFGGVLFKIPDGPRSVVVLKSSARTAGDLPEKVAIPVGRKFDTLFFLHSGAWCDTQSKEFFRYVLHYADGKDVTLSVGPGNMKDWTGEPVARFPVEQDTFSTVAETVKVPQFGRGSVYRMEWSAPADRRTVEIKSIEFVGNGSCVPILVGITGVMEW